MKVDKLAEGCIEVVHEEREDDTIHSTVEVYTYNESVRLGRVWIAAKCRMIADELDELNAAEKVEVDQ